jgi:hypothetical protein
MPVQVFHDNEPNFGFPRHNDRWPEGFSLVATVDTNDINHAFALTQHVEDSWTNNDRVNAEPGEHRSTSVGDVLVCDGETYRCENVGWTKLDPR